MSDASDGADARWNKQLKAPSDDVDTSRGESWEGLHARSAALHLECRGLIRLCYFKHCLVIKTVKETSLFRLHVFGQSQQRWQRLSSRSGPWNSRGVFFSSAQIIGLVAQLATPRQRDARSHAPLPAPRDRVRRIRAQVMRANGDQITLPRTTGRHLLSSPVRRLCLFVDNSLGRNQRGCNFNSCALFKRASEIVCLLFFFHFNLKRHETVGRSLSRKLTILPFELSQREISFITNLGSAVR